MSFAQENANCLTTFFILNSDGDPIAVTMTSISVTLMLTLLFLSHFLPTYGRFGIFWNN